VTEARSAAGPRIIPLGDAAVTVAFADRLDGEARERVLALGRALDAIGTPGIVEVVAAPVALTIHYSPADLDYSTLRAWIGRALALAPGARSRETGRLVEIPVVYDGVDLAEVARATGLTAAEVVDLHAGREYQVVLLGFVPGFGYLTELDPRLVLPRRPAPRPRVPAGSVAIAGQQTGIYPAATPGGWHLIGRTSLRMFDPDRHPAALLAVGDRVRFVAER
jgi:KipI family sensor histidine kinase inhibitor